MPCFQNNQNRKWEPWTVADIVDMRALYHPGIELSKTISRNLPRTFQEPSMNRSGRHFKEHRHTYTKSTQSTYGRMKRCPFMMLIFHGFKLDDKVKNGTPAIASSTTTLDEYIRSGCNNLHTWSSSSSLSLSRSLYRYIDFNHLTYRGRVHVSRKRSTFGGGSSDNVTFEGESGTDGSVFATTISLYGPGPMAFTARTRNLRSIIHGVISFSLSVSFSRFSFVLPPHSRPYPPLYPHHDPHSFPCHATSWTTTKQSYNENAWGSLALTTQKSLWNWFFVFAWA